MQFAAADAVYSLYGERNDDERKLSKFSEQWKLFSVFVLYKRVSHRVLMEFLYARFIVADVKRSRAESEEVGM